LFLRGKTQKTRGNKKMEMPKDGKCVDCNTKIVDEFPEVPYILCSGCPRIYQRKIKKGE
jgi:hypothetical protein